jgi:hypothetical protein
MKFLLQFPTLKRPTKFLDCIEKYIGKFSKKHNLHFNINCDYEDTTMNNDSIKNRIFDILSQDNITYDLNFDYETNKISAINSHIDGKEFDIVICISDDMIPIADDWDEIIAQNMNKYFPDTFGCLHFNDGVQGSKLITLSILGKKLYDYFGYIYHPDYKSLYCDDEFTHEVKRLNKVKYIDDIIVSHAHYSIDGNMNSGDYDYAAQKTLFYSGRDGFVFQKRKELGFPKERITND